MKKPQEIMPIPQEIRSAIEKALEGKPYIFRVDPQRKEIDGNSNAVMANFDSDGHGVPGAFYIGRKIAYLTPNYVEWVLSRFSRREEKLA
jgi:hypothetical protein